VTQLDDIAGIKAGSRNSNSVNHCAAAAIHILDVPCAGGETNPGVRPGDGRISQVQICSRSPPQHHPIPEGDFTPIRQDENGRGLPSYLPGFIIFILHDNNYAP